MIGFIYSFRNNKNGKEYIGLTILDIEVRDYSHYYEAYKMLLGGKFNNALRKYGKEGFTRSILYKIEAETKELLLYKLNLLEYKEIIDRDSITNGYNSTNGGRNQVHTTCNNISKAKFNSIYKNSNSIELYDLQGNLLATYPTAMLAERATGAYNGHILKVCTGLRKTHKGFVWKFGHIKSGELREHLVSTRDTAF